MTFGEKLKDLRTNNGMSQGQLAKEVEIAPAYVSQLESGVRDPSLDLIKKLAKVLGVKPGEMLP